MRLGREPETEGKHPDSAKKESGGPKGTSPCLASGLCQADFGPETSV